MSVDLDILLKKPNTKPDIDSLLGGTATARIPPNRMNPQTGRLYTAEEFFGIPSKRRDPTGANIPPVISDVMGGVVKGATAGYVDLGEPSSPVAEKIGEFIGFAAPIGIIGKGSKIIKGVGRLPSFLRSAFTGGVYGGVEKLDEGESRLKNVITDAALFGGMDAALGGVARVISAGRLSKTAKAGTEAPLEIIKSRPGEPSGVAGATSLEAVSRVSQEIKQAIRYVRFNPQTGKVTEIRPTVDLVDQSFKNDVLVKLDKDGKIIDWKSENIRRTPQLEQRVLGNLPKSDDAVTKIIQVIKEAKPVRTKQEALYTAERSKRFTKAQIAGKEIEGEAGLFAELGQLKGALPKVQYEGIKEKIGEDTVIDLFKQIKYSPHITYMESVTARKALGKLFGHFGGGVPTEGELEILSKVFPKEFIEAVKGEGRGIMEHIGQAMLQVANIPRTVMSSIDLSFGLRQGVFLAPRYRKEFYDSFKKQFKTFASEESYKAILDDITKRPTFNFMRGRIAFTDIGKKMGFREERFMSSWAEKIPVLGRGIRASSRAYTGFANKYRADSFDRLFYGAEKLGLEPAKNPHLLDGIAKFVNAGSGRGSIGDFEKSAQILNAFFFSPRLISSRLTLLNPTYYLRQEPFVRKEALKSLFTFVGTGMTVLTAAKLGGADVGVDPRSTDFGKIKIGNTRIDIWGGFQQYVRMAAQILTGEYVSSVTGRKITLGEGYKPVTRLDILARQIESKEAPVASLITTLLRGQDWTGKDVNVAKEIGKRFVPMVAADIYELAQEDPELLPLGALGVFGVGLQTYRRKR